MKKIVLATLISAISVPALSESNLSLEILAGSAKQTFSVDIDNTISPSDRASSFGFRGASKVNSNVAFEVAYINYGEAEDNYTDGFGDQISDKIASDAINLGIKGILPLDNGLSLNARAGLSKWDFELTETDSSIPGQELKLDDDGTDLYYGIGLQFSLNQNLALGAEYTYTKMDISFAGTNVDIENEVKNFALTLAYGF